MKIHLLRPWTACVDKDNYNSFIEELQKCRANEEIRLLVSCYGGTVALALSFYDIVVQSRLSLTTIGTGEVSSSAIIIWLAGRKRLLTPHTTIFFHEISTEFPKDTQYDATELDSRLKIVNIQQRYMAGIISSRSGGKLSRADVIRLMKEEGVLMPREAVKLGLAHGIITR